MLASSLLGWTPSKKIAGKCTYRVHVIVETVIVSAKKKIDKSYNPINEAMMSKWEKAVREAEEIMGLTRLERVEHYLVTYGVNNTMPPNPSPVRTPKPAPSPNSNKAPVPATAVLLPVKRTPGPASKTGV